MSTQAGNQLMNTSMQATMRRGTFRSKGIQCSLIDAPPLELLTPSPLVADGSDNQAEEMTEEVQTPMTADDPPSVRLNFPDPRPEPHLEEKFIVFQEELMALFDACPLCAKPASANICKHEGTCIHVHQECLNFSCGFSRVWRSQPYDKKMPLGNLLLSSAILFSGSLPTQALRIFSLLNVQAIAVSTFFRHQSHYLFPVVEHQWQTKQKEIIDELTSAKKNLVLIGDGRSDSPGHSAKYGSYTVIEQNIQKVVHMQAIQSNEVKNASWCELEGLQRTIEFLDSCDLEVGTLVTDRHPQINKWLRDLNNLREWDMVILHLFDIWHIGKSVSKKLDKVGLVKGCEEIGPRKRAIRNHLYWVAVSTPSECGETKIAKWLSALYHLQDIHTNLPYELFSACQHEELEEERQWMEPTTTSFTAVEKLMTDKRLLGDISRMSSGEQTGSLEASHSLILHFEPKHTAFSWLGMRTRLRLAALHYNDNSRRMQAVSSDGEPRYNLYYSKAQAFEPRVRPVSTAHTLVYARQLQETLFHKYRESPKDLRSSIDKIRNSQPAPLSSKAT